MAIPGKHFARILIERRNLLGQLVRRDFEQRFIGSAGGWLWGLIHPLVLLVSWVFVFQWCMKIQLPKAEVTQNYPLFLFCGFLPWLLFQDTVQRSASSLLDHSNLITKTVFPSEIVPVSIFLSSLLNHLLALVLAIGIVVFEAQHLSIWILSLPLYMLLIGLFAIGIGWIVAGLHVYLRDTAQVLVIVLTFWFWVTPVMIGEEQFPARVRPILHANPLAFMVRAYRERLLSSRLPDLHDIAVTAAYALTIFVIGGLFFRHLKRGFADVL
ncbi:MAG TPA: ABC transporter permease [Bryobacteraceae bacterium]|nr:ABC transporter permease [Bryobacteraceae bacterium]